MLLIDSINPFDQLLIANHELMNEAQLNRYKIIMLEIFAIVASETVGLVRGDSGLADPLREPEKN
ncbi:MAG: hypothetical protein ABIQ74_10765 [Chitinophagales bacterium]